MLGLMFMATGRVFYVEAQQKSGEEKMATIKRSLREFERALDHVHRVGWAAVIVTEQAYYWQARAFDDLGMINERNEAAKRYKEVVTGGPKKATTGEALLRYFLEEDMFVDEIEVLEAHH